MGKLTVLNLKSSNFSYVFEAMPYAMAKSKSIRRGVGGRLRYQNNLLVSRIYLSCDGSSFGWAIRLVLTPIHVTLRYLQTEHLPKYADVLCEKVALIDSHAVNECSYTGQNRLILGKGCALRPTPGKHQIQLGLSLSFTI